jgi:hypothetical protein
MNFKQSFKQVVVVAAVIVSASAFAQAKKKPAPKAQAVAPAPAPAKRPGLAQSAAGQNWGMAGCGLGSIVFADQPGMVQIFAATLNGLWGNQTFGITSGTSNCVNQDDVAKRTELFIENNQEVLKKDVAQGQGESVTTLATLLQCSDSAALGQGLQRNFDNIFRSESSSSEVLFEIQRTIKADEKIAQACATAV